MPPPVTLQRHRARGRAATLGVPFAALPVALVAPRCGRPGGILVTALGLELVAEGRFTDTDDSVHEHQINSLHAASVVTGCDDVAFCSSDPLTRAQLATMLVRAFEVPLTSIHFFDDVSTSTHGASVDRLAAAGIAAGWRRSVPARCESGGNWRINTGDGCYGGLQFMLETQRNVGGSGCLHQATKQEQIYR